MSLGMVVLTVTGVLVYAGVLQRVLDRMYLSDRKALLLLALMFAGTWLPTVTFGLVSVSLGGAVIPVGICIYLLIRADTSWERWRAIVSAVISAGAIYGLTLLLPPEAEMIPIEPNLIYGIASGLISWILSRSRRDAWICGVLGILISDSATAVINWTKGIDQQLILGGGGVFDAAVVSGVLAVLLAEFTGEAVERIVRRRRMTREGQQR